MKKGNLSTALSNFDRKPTVVKKIDESSHGNEEIKHEKNSLPPSRRGKKAMTTYFIPEVTKQLKMIALEEDKTIQALMEEAVNELFKKYGKPHIA